MDRHTMPGREVRHNAIGTRVSTGSTGSSVTLTNESDGSSSTAGSKYLKSTQSPSKTFPRQFQWIRGELIGKGSYGRVYMAMISTGEVLAVKQVELVGADESRQRLVMNALKSESDTLKSLEHHPNVVEYLGFESSPTHLSIFLEYVPGGSIGSCLAKHGKFEEDVTKSFMAQVLEGLDFLHAKGIIHRDLKADNLLVEPNGVVKISDFGVSKKADDMSEGRAFTAMQGTVFWMAPEILSPESNGYTSKVDIWSVGCVVLEMWTAMRPWATDGVIPVMMKLHQFKLSPPVPDGFQISPDGLDFRRQCFAPDPDDRPVAAVLRQHRYLKLRPDWVFSPSDIEKSSAATLKQHNIPPPPRRRKRRRWADKDLPPIPKDYDDETSRSPAPPAGMTSPPLVFITPSRPSPSSYQYTASNEVPLPPQTAHRPMLVLSNPDEGRSRTRPLSNIRVATAPVLPLNTRLRTASASSSASMKRPDINANQHHHAQTSPGMLTRVQDDSSGRAQDVDLHLSPDRFANIGFKTKSMENIKAARGVSYSHGRKIARETSSQGLNLESHRHHRRHHSEVDKASDVSGGRAPQADNWVMEIIHQISSDGQAASDAEAASDYATAGESTTSDSEDDFSSSMWQKRPDSAIPHSSQGKFITPPIEVTSPIVGRRKSKMLADMQRPVSWAPRPFVEDVVSHLEEFFPNYDLDKPLIEIPGVDDRVRPKRSIRHIAKESINRRRSDPSSIKRTPTKVWGSRMREVTTSMRT